MPCDVVLGAQWGDEGKGKIVDFLAQGAAAVVRFQGGANAGHTLVVDARRIALHLVPSGVAHPECALVLGNGMVIDPLALLDEIEALEAHGFAVRSRLRVSPAAHVVLPCHRLQDRVEERRRGAGSVGTTGRGIGPAYADKAARTGVQMRAFLRPEVELRQALQAVHEGKRALLGAEADFDPRGDAERLVACGARLAPLVGDSVGLLHDLVAAGRRILLEGAQGCMLDLDHGTYPYVTSSACTSAGALAGSGLAPRDLRRVTGVVKAYATRVGGGPFPTELHAEEGERLRRLGHEFGATTGRPRRCGWFDAVAVRYAARLNGFTDLALTKLDVLDTYDFVRVADAYELDGERLDRLPADAAALGRCRPVYTEIEGWRCSTRQCRAPADLPAAVRRFIDSLQERIGVPVQLLSVGPDRQSTFPV